MLGTLKKQITQTPFVNTLYFLLAGLRQSIRKFLTKKYIISYPKSGRTWLRYMLAVYLSKKYDTGLRLDHDHILKKTRDIERFGFTHLKYNSTNINELKADLNSYKNKSVLFLVRDPRDVVVSLFFHYKKREKREEVVSLAEFIRDETCGLPRIVEYYNLVYSFSSEFKSFDMLVYAYIKSDPETCFKKALQFIGESNIDQGIFQYALTESSFNRMKEKEVKKEVDDPRLQPLSSQDNDALKVRKGKIGGYADYFTKEDNEYSLKQMNLLDSQLKKIWL